MKSRQTSSLKARFRMLRGAEIALGPGKVKLLQLVDDTGSIREAAQRAHMSYMRAWSLVRTMNRSFKKPLVETARGGRKHGGTQLTSTGRKVLRIYNHMEAAALRVVQNDWLAMKELLKH